MKPNRAAFRFAVACICLLQSLGVVYAITPRDEPISGTYLLNDREAATKRVHDAIDEAVRGMLPILYGKARNKLKKKNFPPSPEITISFTPGNVTIKSAFGSVQTRLDGKIFKTVIDGDNTDVITIAIGERTLQRIYSDEEGSAREYLQPQWRWEDAHHAGDGNK